MPDKLITPEALLSYPALFEPKTTPSGDLKYSCSLVFQQGTDVSPLEEAARPALEEGWGTKARDMLQRKQLKWPFRDGAEKDGRGYGPGTTFVNVTSKQPPGVVDRYGGADGRPRAITESIGTENGLVEALKQRGFRRGRQAKTGRKGFKGIELIDEWSAVEVSTDLMG